MYYKLKKKWKKEYLLWLIVLGWSILFWEGHRIIPGAKYLSEIIPIWIVILNSVLFVVSFTLLINKKDFLLKGTIITLVGYLFSMIFLSIGYKRFPLITVFTLFCVILVNWVLKEWKANE